jgi:tetratricopeptide (TPR) repeat protein
VLLKDNKAKAQKKAYAWANGNYSREMAQEQGKLDEYRRAGKRAESEMQEASNSANSSAFSRANSMLAVEKAEQDAELLTTGQLADRQDKINSALRKAVAAYQEAAAVAGGDKAGEALLRMAVIYNERLGDPKAAMATWLEIVRQFSGTAVAEEASWQIAQHYEHAGQYAEAVEAYKAFLRNYRSSPKASEAQFFIAENYEHLGQWVSAMDQYTNYLNNFPQGPMAQKAREQISFIKTYRL